MNRVSKILSLNLQLDVCNLIVDYYFTGNCVFELETEHGRYSKNIVQLSKNLILFDKDNFNLVIYNLKTDESEVIKTETRVYDIKILSETKFVYTLFHELRIYDIITKKT